MYCVPTYFLYFLLSFISSSPSPSSSLFSSSFLIMSYFYFPPLAPPSLNSSPPSPSPIRFSFLHISKGWHDFWTHFKILFKLSYKLIILNFLPFQLFRHSYLAQYSVYDIATTWVLTLFLKYALLLENNSYRWNTKVLSANLLSKRE